MELIDRLPLGWKPVTWEFSIIPSEDDRYFKTPREVYNEQYQLREAKQREKKCLTGFSFSGSDEAEGVQQGRQGRDIEAGPGSWDPTVPVRGLRQHGGLW